MHRLRHIATGRASLRALSLAVLCIALFSVLLTANSAVAQSPNIVISQVYGGGGGASGTYQSDYVELFNRGSSAQSLNGWSVQYASAAGSFNAATALPNVSVPAGGYYLVVMSTGAGLAPLPIPADHTSATSILMSGTAGKVLLANSTTALACGATGGSADPCSPAELELFIDLVGYGTTATLYETTGVAGTSPTANLSATTAAFRNTAGCTDTDNNGSDFAVTAPSPRNSATALAPCGPVVNTPPTVTSTSPANGALDVAWGDNVVVNFSEPVAVSDDWYTLVCTQSGTRTPSANNATVSGGPQSYTIDPDNDLGDGESCTLTIVAAQVEDLDASPLEMEEDYTASFSTVYSNPCLAPYTTIGVIQGSGAASPMTGQVVTTMGVVTADFQGAAPTLRGYFLQSQDGQGDGDPLTSDGIFVFTANDNTVSQGDLVRVVGTVGENFNQTQLSNSTATNCGTGYTVANTTLTLPVPAPAGGVDYLERHEGMMVTIPQTMTVSDLYYYGRFHQIVLSANGRLIQPTHLYEASDPARAALQEENDLRRILLDDALNGQNLMPLSFGRGGNNFTVSPFNILRAGDTVANVTGVLNYTFGGVASSSPNAWRVRPTTTDMPNFQAVNERPAALPRTAPLRVGSLNLLNFFNSFGTTGCQGGVGGATMECRGALSQADFESRQVPKTVQALLKLDADIIAVNEIENDGYGAASAIQELVDSMNAIAGAGTWTFVNPDAALSDTNTLGTDAIKVGILYKPASVTPLGTAVLNTPEFVYTYDTAPRNRPALAQSFLDAYGAEVMVVVNHLKSKGSVCIDDGPVAGVEGNCSGVRAYATNELMSWVSGLPTGTDSGAVLLVGDFNSYAKEAPISNITGPAQYTDLAAHFGGPSEYSYVFGGQWGYLDYAFASAQLIDRVVYAAPWHINSDEASVLDHSTEFKPAAQQALWEPNEFRTSDHDPLVVDIVPPSYPLTVTVVANNASIGSVTSIPAGISCGVTCTAEFYQNAPVTLTATTDVSSHLVGWSEASCGTNLTCTVPMTTTAKSVTATFDINVYTLTTATDGTGSGTVSPSGSVTATHGSTVTITATPAGNSNLSGWSETSCGTALTCDVNLTADKTVTATFDLKVYTLTTATDGTGSGTVSPSGSVTATHGSTVTITATPAGNSNLSGWSETSCGTALTCDVNLTADKTVTATFDLKVYTLTTATDGSGTGTGTLSPSGSVTATHGSTVTITATPAGNSNLSGWSETSCGTALTCDVNLTADKTVTATFDLKVYTLTTATDGTGTGTGTLSPSGSVTATHGSTVTITATPDISSNLSGWSETSCGTALTCDVNLTADKTVTATFDLKVYTLTTATDGSGTGTGTLSPSGSVTATHGSTVTITATPDISSNLSGWSEASCGTALTCDVNLTADKTVTATFDLKQLALVVNKVGSGTVTPASGTHPYGSQVTLTAAPADGWAFDAWSGACVGSSLTCTFTITADSTVTATFLEVYVPPTEYALSVQTEGNGAVTSNPAGIDCGEECTDVLLEGSVITLTATADTDSDFTGWSGACSGTATTCVITMDGNRAVTATFTLKSYEVIVIDPATGGSIEVEVLDTASAAGAGTTYPYGTVLQFTAVAETGYTFGGWTSDAASFGTQNPIQITVTESLTIGASFVSAEPATSFIFLPTVAGMDE